MNEDQAERLRSERNKLLKERNAALAFIDKYMAGFEICTGDPFAGCCAYHDAALLNEGP